MDILGKHKKKGQQGFQEFVYYLELADKKRFQDVMDIIWLEDPVYAQHLTPNMVNFSYFLNNVSDDDTAKIYLALPTGPQTFIMALRDTPEKDIILPKLPALLVRRYKEAEDMVNVVTASQRLEARNTLIRKMRELQDQVEITPFSWKLPESKILKGEHFLIPSNGRFQLKYENDNVALEGGFEKKFRAGVWAHFHPNGKLLAKGQYSQGEKVGLWTFFSAEGKRIGEGEYKENLRSGQWKIYDSEGAQKMVTYERGRPRS